MERANNGVVLTTFGTKLRPINIETGLFILIEDATVVMDTPLQDKVGTKKTFKKGSVVKGTFWKEASRNGKTRKVVMVAEDLAGRYLINKKSLMPTTQAEVDAKESQNEVVTLNKKVDALLDTTKEEIKEIVADPKGALDKEYFGFTGKQILVATLGVIVLIKVFK